MPVLQAVRDEDLSQSSEDKDEKTKEQKQQWFNSARQVIDKVPLERQVNSKLNFLLSRTREVIHRDLRLNPTHVFFEESSQLFMLHPGLPLKREFYLFQSFARAILILRPWLS